MHSDRRHAAAALPLFVAACCTAPDSPSSLAAPRIERIVVAADVRGFVTERSRRPFHPWGMNYGNAGRLMEDFWQDDWPTLAGDLRELRLLGANVVRVHLQFGRFMRGADEPDPRALAHLEHLLRDAEAIGIYLDVTGLGCYRPEDTPAWYTAMAEPERWASQACFWSAVAATCAGSPAVFCYDLANEPISPAERREPGRWASGSRFGGFDFLQYIALEPAGRSRADIAVAWIRQLTAAIRAHDRETLITVGLLPWSRRWQHLSGFLPAAVAPELDFISVHLYPDSSLPGEALEALQQFAVGKPVVVEETFPLQCSVEELEQFLFASREFACGWLGHYDGSPPDELDALEQAGKLTIAQHIYRSWLRLFVRLGPSLAQSPQ